MFGLGLVNLLFGETCKCVGGVGFTTVSVAVVGCTGVLIYEGMYRGVGSSGILYGVHGVVGTCPAWKGVWQ